MIKEACVETFKEALLAEQNGADRIELCSDLANDGLTPPVESDAKNLLGIKNSCYGDDPSTGGKFCLFRR